MEDEGRRGERCRDGELYAEMEGWKTEDGRMEDGRWKMEDGRWKMEEPHMEYNLILYPRHLDVLSHHPFHSQCLILSIFPGPSPHISIFRLPPFHPQLQPIPLYKLYVTPTDHQETS